MGRCVSLGAFIPSRFGVGQVVNVVLVQFTQFRADTGKVLIHLASEIGKALIHLRAQAANSLEYNNRKNSNILEMFIKMMIDSKAGLFHKPKSIQKKQPPATPIDISRVYLQVWDSAFWLSCPVNGCGRHHCAVALTSPTKAKHNYSIFCYLNQNLS